jgi:hypothetical protein
VLTLKDEIPGRRPDGREEAVVSWEAEFTPPEGRMQGVVCLPWAQFKPFYRGREVKDAQPLKTEGIRRLGLMMRRYVLVPCFEEITRLVSFRDRSADRSQFLRRTVRRFRVMSAVYRSSWEGE